MNKEDLILAFEDKANELGMCLDQQWGEYENPYTNSDTFLAYDLFKSGVQAQKQENESLKAQLAQYQSDDYVLVPVSSILGILGRGSKDTPCKTMIEAQEQHNAKP